MTLSNYRIKSELGQGGMATVYLAHDNKFDTNVAIKVLRKEYVQNENIRKRFLAEARNMFKMSHPNIIKVTDLIEEDETVAFVMEYVDGETLKEYIDRKGKLSDLEINSLFAQILNALDYVHKQQLVHRDIKPSNFMINHDLQIKLMDFGIAKTSDVSSNEYTQTGTGVQMGTPIYMSPEQITETKTVTAQSDIYSLGVVLWQMITGQKPYHTNTLSTFQLQTKIVNEKLPKTYSVFDDIIQKATNKNPDKRYKDIQAIKDAINFSVKTQKDDETVVDTKKKDLEVSISNKKSYKKLLKWSAGIVIMVSICSSGYFYSKSDEVSQKKYLIGCIENKLGEEKFGFIDTKGNWVIQPIFDWVDPFKDGLAGAFINGKRGYIDSKGNWVIQPIFDRVDPFKDGLARAKINGKYGYIDTKGNWVIQPIFDKVLYFNEGLASAKINGKYGYIDTKGNWVIQPIFDRVYSFSEGLASAAVSENPNDFFNDKCGFIDKKGNWVIQPIFDYVSNFKDGLAEVHSNGKEGFIDKKGNWVIQPIYDEVQPFYNDGPAKARINDKWGFIDKKGNWVIQPIFDYVSKFKEDLAWAWTNNKGGFIDTKGNWVIQPIFESSDYFESGIAPAKINGKWGFINIKGNWVIQPIYDEVQPFYNDGPAKASINGKSGYIDKKGNWVIQPIFDKVEYFEDDLAKAEINGKYGYIDAKGNWVIHPIYKVLKVEEEGVDTIDF
jgi:serine/threonine protein kinase